MQGRRDIRAPLMPEADCRVADMDPQTYTSTGPYSRIVHCPVPTALGATGASSTIMGPYEPGAVRRSHRRIGCWCWKVRLA